MPDLADVEILSRTYGIVRQGPATTERLCREFGIARCALRSVLDPECIARRLFECVDPPPYASYHLYTGCPCARCRPPSRYDPAYSVTCPRCDELPGHRCRRACIPQGYVCDERRRAVGKQVIVQCVSPEMDYVEPRKENVTVREIAEVRKLGGMCGGVTSDPLAYYTVQAQCPDDDLCDHCLYLITRYRIRKAPRAGWGPNGEVLKWDEAMLDYWDKYGYTSHGG